MNAWPASASYRAVTWLVIIAMLLPVVSACATTLPATIVLEGIVVDGQRLARPGETGHAWVVRDGVSNWANAGTELREGDRIATGPNAEVVIRYPSGSEVLMRANSSARIGSLTGFVGEVFIKVKGLFSVETTYVKAGTRGTAFLVHTGSGGTTTVIVFDGSVVVESTTRAWAPVTLDAGLMAVAHPRPPQSMRASPEDLRRTQDWVERLERLVPPPTHVSGTGVAVAVGIAVLVGAILENHHKNPSSSPPPTGSVPAGTLRAK